MRDDPQRVGKARTVLRPRVEAPFVRRPLVERARRVVDVQEHFSEGEPESFHDWGSRQISEVALEEEVGP